MQFIPIDIIALAPVVVVISSSQFLQTFAFKAGKSHVITGVSQFGLLSKHSCKTPASKSIEEQTKTNAEMSQTLSKINNNMDLMATEIQNTNNRVEKLEVQLKKNDDDNTIKIMPLVKNFVLKILFPTTALGFIIYETAKALKLIKIGE